MSNVCALVARVNDVCRWGNPRLLDNLRVVIPLVRARIKGWAMPEPRDTRNIMVEPPSLESQCESQPT
jgi:hypothetical protein